MAQFGVAEPGIGQNEPWRPGAVLTNFVWEDAPDCEALEGRSRADIVGAPQSRARAAGRNGVPVPRTSDPAAAAALLEEHGVVVIDLSHELQEAIAAQAARGAVADEPPAEDYEAQSAQAEARAAGSAERNPFRAACEALPGRIWGDGVLSGGHSQEAPSFVAAQEKFNHSHTDGNGDCDSDFLLLFCESQATHGGANVIVDGYSVLEDLAADEATRWVVSALEARPVDIRNFPGEPTLACRPLLQRVPGSGRLAALSLPPLLKYANPQAGSSAADAARDTEMLRLWATAIRRAEMETERILLQPGQCCVLDNFRCFHARETFTMTPTRRTIYQGHVHTDKSFGLPGPGHGRGERPSISQPSKKEEDRPRL